MVIDLGRVLEMNGKLIVLNRKRVDGCWQGQACSSGKYAIIGLRMIRLPEQFIGKKFRVIIEEVEINKGD